mgnify:CR=1 FL=1
MAHLVCEERFKCRGRHATRRVLTNQRVEGLPEPETGFVELQDGRGLDGFLVEARHVDEQRRIVQAAAMGLQAQDEFEETSPEVAHGKRELSPRVALGKGDYLGAIQ